MNSADLDRLQRLLVLLDDAQEPPAVAQEEFLGRYPADHLPKIIDALHRIAARMPRLLAGVENAAARYRSDETLTDCQFDHDLAKREGEIR